MRMRAFGAAAHLQCWRAAQQLIDGTARHEVRIWFGRRLSGDHALLRRLGALLLDSRSTPPNNVQRASRPELLEELLLSHRIDHIPEPRWLLSRRSCGCGCLARPARRRLRWLRRRAGSEVQLQVGHSLGVMRLCNEEWLQVVRRRGRKQCCPRHRQHRRQHRRRQQHRGKGRAPFCPPCVHFPAKEPPAMETIPLR